MLLLVEDRASEDTTSKTLMHSNDWKKDVTRHNNRDGFSDYSERYGAEIFYSYGDGRSIEDAYWGSRTVS